MGVTVLGDRTSTPRSNPVRDHCRGRPKEGTCVGSTPGIPEWDGRLSPSLTPSILDFGTGQRIEHARGKGWVSFPVGPQFVYLCVCTTERGDLRGEKGHPQGLPKEIWIQSGIEEEHSE